jgi:hypothetical protein
MADTTALEVDNVRQEYPAAWLGMNILQLLNLFTKKF